MHWYKRNLGDYAKKAGRLSMLQHGSYTLLIDACYDRERFPTLDEAIEWTWASTPEEVDAVKFVLSKFFKLGSDGTYTQDRILEELLDYQSKADKNKTIAIERETKRREKSTVRAQVVNEPPPNQEPVTSNQEPVTKERTAKQTARGSRLPENFEPDFQFAVDAGIQNTLEEANKFRDYWKSQPGSKGVKLDWPATWRNWCRNAKPRANPYARPEPSATVPSKPGIDPALAKAIKDSLSGAKPSAEIRQKMAQLTGARA